MGEKKQAQKRRNEELSKLLQVQQIFKGLEFIAIGRLNFKPHILPRICQYHGYTSKCEGETDRYVNIFHEMTDRHQCESCDGASLGQYTQKII